jgi:hypothetical protein
MHARLYQATQFVSSAINFGSKFVCDRNRIIARRRAVQGSNDPNDTHRPKTTKYVRDPEPRSCVMRLHVQAGVGGTGAKVINGRQSNFWKTTDYTLFLVGLYNTQGLHISRTTLDSCRQSGTGPFDNMGNHRDESAKLGYKLCERRGDSLHGPVQQPFHLPRMIASRSHIDHVPHAQHPHCLAARLVDPPSSWLVRRVLLTSQTPVDQVSCC